MASPWRALVRLVALLGLAAGLLSVVPSAVAADDDTIRSVETAYWVGTPRVGWTLSARPGVWAPSDVSVEYEWYAGGGPVGRGDTFVPTKDLIGETITLEATASRRGYESQTRAFTRANAVFDGSQPVEKSVDNTETAYFVGTPRVGWTLSARAGKWTPAAVEVTYEWFIGSRRLASGDSYAPVAADLGREITLRATAKASGYRDGTVTWTHHAAVAKGEIFVSGNPTVSGTARVGKTLTARPRGASPKATVSYQWLRGGTVIAGATRSTYKLTKADQGRKISLKAFYKAPAHLDTYRTSASTGAVKK